MLKNLDKNLLNILLTLFNHYLQLGTYPWRSSTITPIHKSGDNYNPDNYRAIALGSCVGKLFSSLLLKRIQDFRNSNCPDHPNQLGFKKGAQTSDHILTLKTIIDKYTQKHSRKIYACFVDYRKAFDSVAREALLYKIAKLGIGGNIFQTLKNMYENTSSRIKLISKLSDHIKLSNGVEQGHPLSPELFKIFIHDLSSKLNDILKDSPLLNKIHVNHLFWADDLVLLSLNEETLQLLIDVLSKHCIQWGLTVNLKKTKIMIFNKAGRLIKPKQNIMLNNIPVETTASYCYLGIVFVPSGKFTTAILELKKKAMRSLFKLKSTVSRNDLSMKSLFKLYDSLVHPILTYGCQIFLPETNFSKILTSKTKPGQINWQQNWLTKIARDSFETIHLGFIKWVLGVHRKASNIGSWGDSSRLPVGIGMIKLFLNYAERASTADENTLLYHSFLEQKILQLPWYSTLQQLKTAFSPSTSVPLAYSYTPNAASLVHSGTAELFKTIWKSALLKSNKLSFYITVKPDWKWNNETYTSLPFSLRKHLTRIRISAHRLAVEKGRQSNPPVPRHFRFCSYCLNKYKNEILGDELHLIYDCAAIPKTGAHINNYAMSLGLQRRDTVSLFNLPKKSMFIFANYLKMTYEEYLNPDCSPQL